MSITLLVSALEYYKPAGITVGYMLPTSKKMRIMGMKKSFESNSTVWFNSIWPYCNPERTGVFKVFINKAVDLLSMGNQNSNSAFEAWSDYLLNHQEIVTIDPLTQCKSWLTREQFVYSLSQCLGMSSNGIVFRVPFQVKLKPGDEVPEVQFPVIVKSNVASVTKMSHIMSIVFNKQGLSKSIEIYNEEFIVQEFINHDMTVYKIYVIGDEISYKPRKSCSNLSFAGNDLVTFNSAEPWPEDLKSGTQIQKPLDMPSLKEITSQITSKLGLSIFGYDILVHSSTNDYIIVDVNVFPGFKEYSNINPYLESLLKSRLSSFSN
jgi:hypothetical protein